MANYTADDVKRLREATAAGMLDCKKALDEADGDYDKAVEIIRVKGLKGVTKREGRLTSNGLVVAKVSGETGVMLELNCETDFVAKGERFGRGFCHHGEVSGIAFAPFIAQCAGTAGRCGHRHCAAWSFRG